MKNKDNNKKVRGVDLTISAPMSISVLWVYGDKIQKEKIAKIYSNKKGVDLTIPSPMDLSIATEWLTPEQCEEVRKQVGKHNLGDFNDGDSFLDNLDL